MACRRIDRTDSGTVSQEDRCAQRRAQEDVAMRRHVNPIVFGAGCCSVERQLWELVQVLEEQNRLLAQMLEGQQEQ